MLQVGAPEALSGALASEAEPVIDMFGEEIARMLYSKQWQHREEGLNRCSSRQNRANKCMPSGLRACKA